MLVVVGMRNCINSPCALPCSCRCCCRHLDQDGDGRLSLEELQQLVAELGMEGQGGLDAAEVGDVMAAVVAGSTSHEGITFETFAEFHRKVRGWRRWCVGWCGGWCVGVHHGICVVLSMLVACGACEACTSTVLVLDCRAHRMAAHPSCIFCSWSLVLSFFFRLLLLSSPLAPCTLLCAAHADDPHAL